jgi:SAM-dependent methyltransferase
MDRATWIRERRLWNEVQMDTIYARQYDDHWGGYINPTHRAFAERLLDRCPGGARILDAACGTGKYWPMVLERGFAVLGTEQSQGMLDRARTKFPDVPVEKVGLQELAFERAFDGILCMDAMEFVFPEDWPRVVGNLARALQPGGHCYCTVEVESENALRVAFGAGQRLGLPLVWGEYAHHGGYHYYPPTERVEAWLAEAGFRVLETGTGDGYLHFLCQLPQETTEEHAEAHP